MSMKNLSLAIVVVLLLACSAGLTATLTVPAQYATIQAAVTAAVSGDTIEVAAGTYAGPVSIAKSLTLRGAKAGVDPRYGARTAGLGETVISGGTNALFVNGVAVTLDGLEICGATSDVVKMVDADGSSLSNLLVHGSTGKSGMRLDSCASVTVQQCISYANTATNQFADGIKCDECTNVNISNCEFRDNSGRGIALHDSATTTVSDCTVVGNLGQCDGYNPYQGGIFCKGNTGSMIQDCVVTGNFGCGIQIYKESGATIRTCTVTGSQVGPANAGSTPGDGIRLYVASNATIENSASTQNARHGIAIGSVGGWGDVGPGEYSTNCAVSNCELYDNGSAGIGFEGNNGARVCTAANNSLTGNAVGLSFTSGLLAASFTVKGNDIVDNGAGCTFAGSGVLDATRNWWGSQDGPADAAGSIEVPASPKPSVADMKNMVAESTGLLGNSVSDNVDYLVWSSGADGRPIPTVVWVDDNWAGSAIGQIVDGHVFGYDAFDTIQNGINAVAVGGTVNVAAGNYPENLTIGKSVDLSGSGNDASGTVVTGTSYVVRITADDVELANMRITGGVSGGVYTDSQISNLTLNGVALVATGGYGVEIHNSAVVDNLAMNDCLVTGNQTGMRVRGSVRGLQISDCQFDGNNQGLISTAGSGEDKPLQDVQISDSTFNNNSLKGMYFEKLQSASLDGLTVTGSGNGAATGLGIDINLKFATFSDISISDCTVTNCGTFDATLGCGIAVKARDDGDYAAVPATLSNVSISECEVSGGRKGITVGEPARGNAGPTDLNITGCTFGTNSEADVVNNCRTGVVVTATDNTWSSDATTDAEIETHVYHDVDDAALGHVDWGQGAAATAAIVASDVTGTVGQTVQLSAKLTSGGAPIPGAPIAFLVDGASAGSGTTDGAGVAAVPYTISTADNKTITASVSGVTNYKACSDTATLTVNAAKPTSITLTITPGSVTSGQTATCTVMGDNNVDYTDACTYYAQYGAGGSWADNVYTSAKAGTWNLTAVYNTLADSKPLTVAAGAATSLSLTPATATINAGESQSYVVTATDAAGNVWNPVGVITGGAGTWAGNTYTSLASEAGSALTMTAAVGAQTAPATLNINAAAGSGTILAWDKDTQKFYLCSNATDPQQGEEITVSGNYAGGTIPVVVSGGGTNVTVTVGTSSLRVTWYMRSGALYRAYQYSTISSVTKTATYDGRRTLVDGTWKTGFWGLTHTISGGAATYGSAQQ